MALDIALTNRNPATGKFGIPWGPDGNWVLDDSEEWAVVAAIMERQNEYWADSAGTYGSRIRKIKHLVASAPSQIEQEVRVALQPLVDDKRIVLKAVVVTYDRVSMPNRVRIAVTWTKPNGASPKSTSLYLSP